MRTLDEVKAFVANMFTEEECLSVIQELWELLTNEIQVTRNQRWRVRRPLSRRFELVLPRPQEGYLFLAIKNRKPRECQWGDTEGTDYEFLAHAVLEGYVASLINQAGEICAQQPFSAEGTVYFSYMPAETYTLNIGYY